MPVQKIRLHKVAKENGEHKLLGRAGFHDLVQFLRVHPTYGEPRDATEFPCRIFVWIERFVVHTTRNPDGELVIVQIDRGR